MGDKIQDAFSDLEDAQAKVKNLTSDLEVARNALEKKDFATEKVKSEVKVMEDDLREARSRADEAMEAVDGLKAKIEVRSDKVMFRVSRIALIVGFMFPQDLESQLKDAGEDSEDLNKARDAVKQLEAKVTESEAEIKALKAEKEDFEAKLKE